MHDISTSNSIMLHYKDSRVCIYHFKIILLSKFEFEVKIKLTLILKWKFKSAFIFESDFFITSKVHSLLFAA
jgi:hypothetical protein